MDLISASQEFYKSSKRKFDADEAFKKRAQEAVVKLQVTFIHEVKRKISIDLN